MKRKCNCHIWTVKSCYLQFWRQTNVGLLLCELFWKSSEVRGLSTNTKMAILKTFPLAFPKLIHTLIKSTSWSVEWIWKATSLWGTWWEKMYTANMVRRGFRLPLSAGCRLLWLPGSIWTSGRMLLQVCNGRWLWNWCAQQSPSIIQEIPSRSRVIASFAGHRGTRPGRTFSMVKYINETCLFTPRFRLQGLIALSSLDYFFSRDNWFMHLMSMLIKKRILPTVPPLPLNWNVLIQLCSLFLFVLGLIGFMNKVM